MALTRKWMPSPNVSSRGGGTVRLIVIHTTEGAQDITSLGSFFGSSSVQASSHVGIDNATRGTIGEYVKPGDKAWTQANYNPVCISAELCTPSGAAAGWSRDTWMSKGTMLANTADWIKEEAGRYGIPVTRLSASAAQGSGRGVCGHMDLGAGGGGHNDPGNGFPWDYVLGLAGGTAAAPPPPASGGVPAMSVDYFGRAHNSGCPDVRTWQAKMASWGWFNAGDVDGQFGPQSESVAKRFQTQKGLTADGMVGPETWRRTWTG